MNADLLAYIDGICDSFEAQRRAGGQPRIEDHFSQKATEFSEMLLTHLLPMEIELRRHDGANPTVQEYLERLPDCVKDVIVEVFDDDEERDSIRQVDTASADPQPRQVGPYKIVRLIAEGGMGSVYEAEQTAPVRRVALKVIKAGMDSKEILARFEAERQALAMMDHQNIAKVLDGGVTDGGQPYFAMELVNGIQITKYCDQNKLNLDNRLELFVQVCQAVQHAHQQGVIHRDLKPSNVLVTLYDGRPVAKVIDFGLAKALQPQTRLTDRTLFTRVGTVVGTLEYMSPEQAELNELSVDPRTDVYSLGVLLFELLTGSTPLGRDRVESEAIHRVLQLIREEEAPRPSERLSGSVEATSISEQRQIDSRRLGVILKGELDWIAVKALEKDRTRRYAGAGMLADDVQRYLNREAVQARPPSVTYRLQKTVRKHKAAFATGTVIVLLLVAGLVGTGTMWMRAKAEQRQRLITRAKMLEEGTSQTASEYLKDLSNSPSKEGVHNTIRERLTKLSNKGRAKNENRLRLGLLPDKQGATTIADNIATFALSDSGLALQSQPDELLLICETLKRHCCEASLTTKGTEALAKVSGYITGLNCRLKTATLNREQLEDDLEHHSKLKAHTAVLLMKMGSHEEVWPLLRHSKDPRVRSYIIHWLSKLEIDPNILFAQFKVEKRTDIRLALLLCLGECDQSQLNDDARKKLIGTLRNVYRSHADAGLHAAAEWLLRQWKQGGQIAAIHPELQQTQGQLRAGQDKTRRWYINKSGQTFVILTLNADKESSNNTEGHRRFAMCTTEVTHGQWERSQKKPMDLNNKRIKTYPADGNWYTAVKYCNWLSKQEGLPKYYEINGEEVISKKDGRFGYRLPTVKEWEYACRAGAETSRFYGETIDLLESYARVNEPPDVGVEENVRWPVAGTKPNDFGLFDMLGNAYEWCGPDMGGETVARTSGVPVRGGAVCYPTFTFKWNRPDKRTPDFPLSVNGFRVARTLPPDTQNER